MSHSRLSTVVAALTLVAMAVCVRAEPEGQQELRRAHEAALAAHEQKDYPAFLAHSRRVVELAPRSTRALYNLACAQALTGGTEEALRLLDRIASMGVLIDPGADADFVSIKETPEFQAILRKLAALNAPIGRSTVAFTLREKDLITEGVAHDLKTGAFLVSSVHRRKVVRIGNEGEVSDFVPQGQDGLFSAMALAVDAPRNVLWVSTAAEPVMVDYRQEDKDRSAVLEYDLTSGKLLRRLEPPASVRGGRLSDVAVGPAGELYVADPVAGSLYVVDLGASALRVLVAPGKLKSPQGLARHPEGGWLFVADYVQGLFRVDLRDGSVRALESATESVLTGIDGLVYHAGALVGIQNGVRPHRVLRARLSTDGSAITEVETLERANPHFDEPTLGVLVGSDLYYVANSQYGAIGADGRLDATKLREPVILKMPLVP
jgi:sugar lactone lactonase YvrE